MRRFWIILNLIYERAMLIVFVVALLIVLYGLYDSYLVYQKAGDDTYLSYKPIEGQGMPADSPITEDMVAWITVDNTNVDYVKFTLPGYTPSSSSSGEPAAIAQDIRMNGVFKSLQVFDMQGRNLGRVSVAAGASIQEALFAKFHKAGIYLVKQGSQVMRVRVTR